MGCNLLTVYPPTFWGPRDPDCYLMLWQGLTVPEVQKLLGPHIVGLKTEEDKSPVRDWIFRQRQEELDRLGLGLQGGIPSGYLVLDLNVRGELGCPGAELGDGVRSLSGLFSLQRRFPVEPHSLDQDLYLHGFQLCSQL